MTLEFSNVVKRVGNETHLYDTSLSLEPGGFNILLGETGAGKTTLIKLMAGLEKPSSGRILLNGVDVTRQTPQQRNVSLVHQFFVNYPHMTVFENIASPLRIARHSAVEIKRRVGEVSDLLKLGPYLDRLPASLSGGQQQRTALARAIVKDSSLVMLDEPLANLDYKLREELREELPQLLADRGSIVVHATSEPSEALLLGGQTATMAAGRITQFGSTGDVYRTPRNLESAKVFSDPPINVARVTKQGGAIHLDDVANWPAEGAIASAPDGVYHVAVRPHHVTPLQATEDFVPLTGRVKITELSGSESVAHFDLAGQLWVAQSHGVHPYSVGETHEFHMDVRGCLYFDRGGGAVAS